MKCLKNTRFQLSMLPYCSTQKKTQTILLSGDKALRKAAHKEKVTVKGVLWVLETLVGQGSLGPDQATLLLERMFLLGRRLPPDESSSKILKWEQEK